MLFRSELAKNVAAAAEQSDRDVMIAPAFTVILADMTNIGLPVPFGLTVTTQACNMYTIKNHTFLKEIFAVTGEPETPYEILRKYDYFSETNNMLGDVLDQLNALSELYPDPEQVQELATFKIGELKETRDKLGADIGPELIHPQRGRQKHADPDGYAQSQVEGG